MDHRAETEARLNATASHTLAYLVEYLDEFARPGEAEGLLQAAHHALDLGLTGPCSPASGETLHYRLQMVAKAALGLARHTTTADALDALREGVLEVAVRAAEVLADRDAGWGLRAQARRSGSTLGCGCLPWPSGLPLQFQGERRPPEPPGGHPTSAGHPLERDLAPLGGHAGAHGRPQPRRNLAPVHASC